MKVLYIVAVVYTFLSYLGTMAAYLFACLPIHRNWDIMSADFCSTVLEAAPLHVGLALNITSDILRTFADSRSSKFMAARLTKIL